MNTEEHHISVIDAANKLGVSKGALFRILKRYEVETFKLKSAENHGQKVAHITIEDFEYLKENYVNPKALDSETSIECEGLFYLIQLEPELAPNRFKLGFTTNLKDRLSKHRCSAPYAQVVKTWECHVTWEKTAIDAVTQGAQRVYEEVYLHESIEKVTERCEAFFNLLPAPSDRLKRV